MKTYERKSFPRMAKDFARMFNKGTITFDNAYQRNFCWKNTEKDNRMSMLVDSMLRGFPVPPMYCNCIKNEDSEPISDFSDGQQRTTTVVKFLNNEFTLIGLDTFEDENGNEIDINGLTFDELPEDMKDTFKTYSFTVYYYENMDNDDFAEMFSRLNNGAALKAIEKTRAMSKSFETIKLLGNHELLKSTLSDAAIKNYTNEDIVIKTHIMLNAKNPCLDTKVVRPYAVSTEFTENDIETITRVFDTILACYNYIMQLEENSKVHAKIAKRLITRTHLITVTPLVRQCLDMNLSVEDLAKFFLSFFNGKKGATNYDKYNSHCTSGSGHESSVAMRLDAVNDAWKKFEKENVVKPEEKVEAVEEVVEVEETVKEEISQEDVDSLVAALIGDEDDSF